MRIFTDVEQVVVILGRFWGGGKRSLANILWTSGLSEDYGLCLQTRRGRVGVNMQKDAKKWSVNHPQQKLTAIPGPPQNCCGGNFGEKITGMNDFAYCPTSDIGFGGVEKQQQEKTQATNG